MKWLVTKIIKWLLILWLVPLIFYMSALYGAWHYWISPYLQGSGTNFSYNQSDLSGLPFSLNVTFTQPKLVVQNHPTWHGDQITINWDIFRPFGFRAFLHGDHILDIAYQDILNAGGYSHNLNGSVYLTWKGHVRVDLSSDILQLTQSVSLANIQDTFSAKDFVFSYEFSPFNPTLNEKFEGHLFVDAKEIHIPPSFNSPLKGTIKRVHFKADGRIPDKDIDIPITQFSWQNCSFTGSGHLKRAPNERLSIILKSINPELFITHLTENKALTPKDAHKFHYAITTQRQHQNKFGSDPVYLPINYENNKLKIGNIHIPLGTPFTPPSAGYGHKNPPPPPMFPSFFQKDIEEQFPPENLIEKLLSTEF